MLVRCYCGAHWLNPEEAIYVKEGKPLCHEYTCRSVRERMDREHDRVAEVYGRHTRYKDI